MERDLSKIAAYSAALVQEDWALSRHWGKRPFWYSAGRYPPPQFHWPRSRRTPQRKSEKPAEEFAPRAAKNVAKITRDTLNAIAFPTFVADLIKGTYFASAGDYPADGGFWQTASNVAQTVDEFMAANISENRARFSVSSYPSQLLKSTLSGDGPIVKHKRMAPDSVDFKSTFGLSEDVIRTSRKRSWFPPQGVNLGRTGIRCWPRW
jgi:hypothetical protein